MLQIWTSHIRDQEGKDHFKKSVYHLLQNDPVVKRLKEIVEQRKASCLAAERSQEVYESPNWACLQAHNNGWIQALAFIEALLRTTTEKEQHNDRIV